MTHDNCQPVTSRQRLTCILFIAILLIGAGAANASLLELEYTFERPTVETVLIDGQQYSRITLAESPTSGSVGHPALPIKGARVLIPYGHKVDGIEVIYGDPILVGHGYLVEPVELPFPLSIDPADIPPLFLDSLVYLKSAPIPESKFTPIGIYTSHGYRIQVLQLHPVEYIPVSGSLYYYPHLALKVRTSPSNEPGQTLRSGERDRHEVSIWVDNQSVFSTYDQAEKRGAANYDMLIVTTTSLAPAFQPLKEYHDTTGCLTEIRTIDQIGSSDPHAIRDYIRGEYQANGIQYVLLGGDDDLIPALDLYVEVTVTSGSLTAYDMPGDFYYSCLDGTFDYDGDGLFGEPTDGEGGGDVDLFPEVHVGRFGANNTTEVTNLANKTIAYLESNSPYLQSILLVGEELRFGGLGEYGGYAMDEMVDGASSHGFLTYAFPSSEYTIDKLYDLTSMPSNYWPPSELINRINAGVHIVNHLGHSAGYYAMRTDTATIRQSLTNTEYCFMYAEGCSAGEFDVMDCWAEYVTTKSEHGAFGCIANSRLGLGARSTRHPVHLFNREFWDAVYRAEEARPQMGRAISDARVDHVYHINEPAIRWNLYEINLFGDPSVAFKSVKCAAITFPDGVPQQVLPQTETPFEVLVAGIGTGVPVPGSGQLHYTIAGRQLVTEAMTETQPGHYTAVIPALACTDSAEFYVSVLVEDVGRFYQPEPQTPLLAVPVSDLIVVFEDDFETDKGWSVSGGLWARGIPTGQGGQELQYPVPDPASGCEGPMVFGYNLNGDYENNLPARHLTSPAIDCSGQKDVHLKFCRWLGVERPIYDHASIAISGNGSDWTTIWENLSTVVDLEWEQIDFDISAYADDQPTVYLRWTMGPTDGALRYNGWNIDNVKVVASECLANWVCGDIDGANGAVDVADLTYIVDFLFNAGPPPPFNEVADINASGGVDVADLTYLVDYLFAGGPPPQCL